MPISPSDIKMVNFKIASDRNPFAKPGPVIFSIFSTIRNLRENI